MASQARSSPGQGESSQVKLSQAVWREKKIVYFLGRDGALGADACGTHPALANASGGAGSKASQTSPGCSKPFQGIFQKKKIVYFFRERPAQHCRHINDDSQMNPKADRYRPKNESNRQSNESKVIQNRCHPAADRFGPPAKRKDLLPWPVHRNFTQLNQENLWDVSTIISLKPLGARPSSN
jgi:hypothetical protein